MVYISKPDLLFVKYSENIDGVKVEAIMMDQSGLALWVNYSFLINSIMSSKIEEMMFGQWFVQYTYDEEYLYQLNGNLEVADVADFYSIF